MLPMGASLATTVVTSLQPAWTNRRGRCLCKSTVSPYDVVQVPQPQTLQPLFKIFWPLKGVENLESPAKLNVFLPYKRWKQLQRLCGTRRGGGGGGLERCDICMYVVMMSIQACKYTHYQSALIILCFKAPNAKYMFVMNAVLST
jgi:hypothetical protein